MSGFEEEAFERARRMAHSRPNGSPPREEKKPSPPPRPVPPAPEPPKPAPAVPVIPPAPPPAPNMLETLFRDREKSLILMMLLLLMDEKSDPTLIFTLMYLLM